MMLTAVDIHAAESLCARRVAVCSALPRVPAEMGGQRVRSWQMLLVESSIKSVDLS